jgi:hypothetical protein
MFFWALSGLFMWWQIKAVRLGGIASLLAAGPAMRQDSRKNQSRILFIRRVSLIIQTTATSRIVDRIHKEWKSGSMLIPKPAYRTSTIMA